MELAKVWDEMMARNVVVVAIAQEDEDLKSHGRILGNLKQRIGGEIPFEVVCDVDRAETPMYDRASTYLIDEDGFVREVLPALTHMRPTWFSVLNRLEEFAEDE